MIDSECKHCGVRVTARGFRPRVLCGMDCKAAWQRTQHPVSNEWLRQKYVVEGLDMVQIGRIVDRDQKCVWNWLKIAGIPTRPRGSHPNPHFAKGRKGSPFAGHRHTAETRAALSRHAIETGRVPWRKENGHPWRGKGGPGHPSWRGGVTPERQAFYSSDEWKVACVAVWHRADARCERCGEDHRTIDRSDRKRAFHVHHIKSFRFRELRACVDNLALLCGDCHRFVHSKRNAAREYLA